MCERWSTARNPRMRSSTTRERREACNTATTFEPFSNSRSAEERSGRVGRDVSPSVLRKSAANIANKSEDTEFHVNTSPGAKPSSSVECVQRAAEEENSSSALYPVPTFQFRRNIYIAVSRGERLFHAQLNGLRIGFWLLRVHHHHRCL